MRTYVVKINTFSYGDNDRYGPEYYEAHHNPTIFVTFA